MPCKMNTVCHWETEKIQSSMSLMQLIGRSAL